MYDIIQLVSCGDGQLLDKVSDSLYDHLQLQLSELFWCISSLHIFSITQLPIPTLSQTFLQHVQGSPEPASVAAGPSSYYHKEKDHEEEEYKLDLMPVHLETSLGIT